MADVPHFALETLEQVRASRIEDLLRAHWQEVAHFPDIALEPDWEAYAIVEAAGMLRIFTVRIAGDLVGYAAYIVKHAPHYKSSLQATQDILFLAPQHRGARIGAHLILFADQYFSSQGVQAVYQHTKVKQELDMGPLLTRLGYELVDALWARRLDRGGR